MTYEELLKRGPYEIGAAEKRKLYGEMLGELTDSHRERCRVYDHSCEALGDQRGRKANGEKKKFPWFRYPCLKRQRCEVCRPGKYSKL